MFSKVSGSAHVSNASSGLTVSYATASDKIAIVNGVATIVKAGTESIEARQPRNATFNAVINATEISATKLVLALAWTKTTLGGGRVESVAGQHVFTFGK